MLRGLIEKLTELVMALLPYRLRKSGRERIRKCLLIFFIGSLLSLIMVFAGNQNLVQDLAIRRKEPGEGSVYTGLYAENEDGERVYVNLEVRDRAYEEEELNDFFHDMRKELENVILGENQSLTEVRGDLSLPEKLSEYPFFISWESNDFIYLSDDGEVATLEELPQGAEPQKAVRLTMTATYRDFEKSYSYLLYVKPQNVTYDFEEMVGASLKLAEEAGESCVTLPKSIAGKQITWKEKKDNTPLLVFFLTIVMTVFFWVQWDRSQKEKEKLRREIMDLEYASLVSKYMLYLHAGLNIYRAWEKICKEGAGLNPVYEEMQYTCREIESGVSEAEGYEHFSRRLASKRYIRLTTLLIQGQSKGNSMLLTQLKEEVALCMEEQRAFIRKKGEEATTKLLFPMVLMMGMIMLMIMFPAFMSL